MLTNHPPVLWVSGLESTDKSDRQIVSTAVTTSQQRLVIPLHYPISMISSAAV